GVVVAERYAPLRPVEEGGRHDLEAAPGIVVADFADVRVDAEDFVQDDEAAAIRAGRVRQIGTEPVAVGGLQVDVVTQRRDALILAHHDRDAHSLLGARRRATSISPAALLAVRYFCSTLFLTNL